MVFDTTNRLQQFRRLAAQAQGSVLLETAQPTPGHQAQSFLFLNPTRLLIAQRLQDLPRVFAEIQAAHAQGLWIAGYLGYECGYHFEPTACPGFEPNPAAPPLAVFGVYTSPLRVENQPQDSPAPQRPGARPDTLPPFSLDFDLTRPAFAEKVSAIHHLIEAGDTYQANLTGRVHGAWYGTPDALFSQMMAAQPVAFGALLNLGGRHILSASPELYFHLQGRHIRVRPMKGTAPRGRTPAEDATLSTALSADAKNRAENLMIVDLLRSDLGRVAEAGSVQVEQLFAIQQLPSLLQMTSTISATLQPHIDFYQLFRALFPSGSIVGAPKVRTMQILRALEQQDRGVYTGAIGYIAPHGEAMFSVAIRTAILHHGHLSMGVGAGITYDSDPAAEYDECLLKANFLRGVLERPFALIETMRWEAGRCALIELHLDRLEQSAAHFNFRFSRETIHKRIRAEGATLCANPPTAWKLRLTMDYAGHLTFAVPDPVAPPASTVPLPCMLWPNPVQAADPFLRHKTTHRAVYDAAIQVARAQGCLDALFVNEAGLLTEGAIHNIFLRHGQQWTTPRLTAGVLPGVYRQHLLRTLPSTRELDLTLTDLRQADEIWLTNAVHGARPVELAAQLRAQPAHPPNSAIVKS